PVYIFENPGTFDVNLTVITGGGCQVDTMQAITINPTPTAFAGEDQEICQGEIVPLTGTGGDSYTWSPAGSLSCSNCPDPMASPTVTTDYVLTAFTDAGCFDRDTVTVVVRPFPIPEISLSRDTFTCTGAFVQLFAESDIPGAVFQWDTTRTGLSCYFNCFNPFATPTETTTYVVSIEGEGGCVAMDSVTVVVLDENVDLAGPDITICEGESAQLSISQGNNPIWTPSIGLSCTNCPDPFVSPDSTQTYFVDVTTDNGCAIRDTINVFVVNLEDVSAGQDTTICVGETIELNAQGPGIIEWIPDPDLDDPLVPNPIASPDSTAQFFATFTIDQCVLTDSVTVTVRDKAEVFGEDMDICMGDTATLLVEGDASNFLWSPDFTLSNPSIANPLAFPMETTTYTVIGSLGTCEPDTTEITVNINEPPTIELEPVIRFFSGQSIELLPEIEGVGGYTYDWTGGETLSCRDCPDPIAAPDTTSSFTLTVTDRNGCSSSATIELRITLTCDDELIVLPNAFTPNGDGLNDLLFVRGSAIRTINLFRVYDRWGTLVFETSNINDGWDGTYKGQPLNTGVYVYYVEAPCSQNGSPLFKKGNVTLIR
ncbi:MAG: gliding motility-associated C-terminal domain-containing protein, partial [Bacteroidota bacterium]